METQGEAQQIILQELESDDSKSRAEFFKHFQEQAVEFSNAMAEAFINWRLLDENPEKDERRAYVSAIIYMAISLHILSMKNFLSGNLIGAGNLMRQVVESIVLALLCSEKDLGILEKFKRGKYSTNRAVQDALRNKKKLGLKEEGIKALKNTQNFYHEYSHPTHLTIATLFSFENPGDLYMGSSFDEGKLKEYKKEVDGRVSLAKVFPNFVDGVRNNLEN